MKYNDTIDIFKTFANAFFDPTSITRNARNGMILKYSKNLENNNFNNISNNAESDGNTQVNNEIVPNDASGNYNDIDNNIENNNYNNKKQDTSSNSQGVIDSISQDLTSVRLQQAIILSEIVGKPRSKNRRKRRRL